MNCEMLAGSSISAARSKLGPGKALFNPKDFKAVSKADTIGVQSQLGFSTREHHEKKNMKMHMNLSLATWPQTT